MWRDPIVEEVRARRAEYAGQFGGDFEAMARDLRERDKSEGAKVVSFPPRRPSRPSDAA